MVHCPTVHQTLFVVSKLLILLLPASNYKCFTHFKQKDLLFVFQVITEEDVRKLVHRCLHKIITKLHSNELPQALFVYNITELLVYISLPTTINCTHNMLITCINYKVYCSQTITLS